MLRRQVVVVGDQADLGGGGSGWPTAAAASCARPVRPRRRRIGMTHRGVRWPLRRRWPTAPGPRAGRTGRPRSPPAAGRALSRARAIGTSPTAGGRAPGCRTASCPAPACGPDPGCRAAGRGEPLIPGAGVVPPSVPAWLPVTSSSSLTKLRSPGRSITGSARTSAGIPLGVNASDSAGTQGVGGPRRVTGVQHAGVGVLLHQHVLGQSAGLTGQRLAGWTGPPTRPGTGRSSPGSAMPPRRSPAPTSQLPTGTGRFRPRRAPYRVLGGPFSGATKWNHAASSSTSTVSPSSTVAKA